MAIQFPREAFYLICPVSRISSRREGGDITKAEWFRNSVAVERTINFNQFVTSPSLESI
jgi:hypothetical protein